MKRDWLQLLTNIAVVIGIGVLIYELNQTHLHNRSQVIAVDYQTLTDINLAMVGDNPAGANRMTAKPTVADEAAGSSQTSLCAQSSHWHSS